MRRFFRVTGALFVAVFLLPLADCRAEVAGKDPRLLVHLLDYLAKDYGKAVAAEGVVLSASEYEEQVEFGDRALGLGRTLRLVKDDVSINRDLSVLKQLIESRAAAEQVTQMARSLQQRTVTLTNFSTAPVVWPSLVKGRQSFDNNCAGCHGATGEGDGPLAAGLSPAPANLLEADRSHNATGLSTFNTIRLGLPGTAMPAFDTLSDEQVWDLAFYVMSLRHQDGSSVIGKAPEIADNTLELASTLTDRELEDRFGADNLKLVRLHVSEERPSESLQLAISSLEAAEKFYTNSDFESAKAESLKAYLEGFEPMETALRANDPELLERLEEQLSSVRESVSSRAPISVVQNLISETKQNLSAAGAAIGPQSMSPLVTFIAGAGIILREGFEGVLVIIALLGVIRASGSRKAAHYVHAGWILALIAGAIAWIFSGYLLLMSGASRETLEAVISIVAVVTLLLVGFWLHSQTEITRWKACIEGKVRRALEGKNLLGLLGVSFLAVFREAFETVLFLRAIWLESGAPERVAMAAGVACSLTAVIMFTWALVQYSTKIPVRKLFTFSAITMGALAVVLAGKAIHAFQEMGGVPVTSLPFKLKFNILGVYPSYETICFQILVMIVAISLWVWGKAPAKKVNVGVRPG